MDPTIRLLVETAPGPSVRPAMPIDISDCHPSGGSFIIDKPREKR